MANETLLGNIYSTVQSDIGSLSIQVGSGENSLISVMLDITIGDLCNNNLKNRMFMQRLMAINAIQNNITQSQLGNGAVKNGDSSQILQSDVLHVSYTKDVNYVDNYVSVADQEKTVETDTNNLYTNYTNHGQLYSVRTNLFPDDLGTLNGESAGKVWVTKNSRSILKKTKNLFRDGKINTIISRFATGADGKNNGITDSSDVVSEYGMSHGNNLLKKDAEEHGQRYDVNGYNNPYCRVWTHHYQYDRLDKLIRPFMDSGNAVTKTKFHQWSNFASSDSSQRNSSYWKSSENKGWQYSVLNDNGFPNIAPKYGSDKNKIHTKQCMFSIENLAWKGYDPYSFEKALSWEQRGPMGGRIMWFPPYGITFNETTQTNWTNHTFIGRGEDVYTYTNTIRSGNLSFMLVVDHPSIIDYISYQNGIESDVKDTDLLRFFAGCDYETLTKAAKPTPLTDEYTEPKSEAYYVKPKLNIPKVDEKEIPNDVETITFYVFYPNNYSGCYDHMGNTVEAIAYLLHGLNAQKRVRKNSDGTYTTLRDDYPLKLESLTTDMPVVNNSDVGQGYEISTTVTNKDNANEYGIGSIFGSKITWEQAKAKGIKQYTSDPNKQWWYRIDGEYKIPDNADIYKNTYDQKLVNNKNYTDSNVYGLNRSPNIVWNFFQEEDKEKLYSLTEVAAALVNNQEVRDFLLDSVKDDEYGDGKNETERVQHLVDLFNSDTMKLTKLTGIGYSNSHGNNKSKNVNSKRNDTLARERVNTVLDWLKNSKNGKFKDLKSEINVVDVSSEASVKVKTNDVSAMDSKKYRSAKITLEFSRTETVKVSDTEQTYQTDGTAGSDAKTVQDGTQKYIGYYEKNGYYVDSKGQAWIEVTDPSSSHYGELTMAEIDSNGNVVGQLVNQTQESKERASAVTDSDGNITGFNGETNKIRYDQEYHFFKMLKQTDPIVFDKLMDKIRYFDPAFHSMTPEGFNARLTFLQQCTRQGDTIGTSDDTNGVASNLAFGRPPFCVLRLGDFYNQMIVIDNISINYDPLTWDTNIEGIGVQPLLANVTISFKFIGGGDMTGPVRRLQNAMTFNYYANARLYDNRADRITYRSNSNDKEQGAAGNDAVEDATYYKAQKYNKNIEDKYV